MSRSYDFGWNLPGGLNEALLPELLSPGCVPDFAYRACPVCRERHVDVLNDKTIPSGAVVSALVRHGWRLGVARHYMAYETSGGHWRHVPRGYGSPLSFRAWRRRNKVLVEASRDDEINPWKYDRGYSFW